VIQPKLTPGTAYQARLIVGGFTSGSTISGSSISPAAGITIPERLLTGAAYVDVPPTGKLQAFMSVDSETDASTGGGAVGTIGSFGSAVFTGATDVTSSVGAAAAAQNQSLSIWIAATCNPNPFNATAGGQALLDLRAVSSELQDGKLGSADDILLNGNLQFGPLQIVGSTTLLQGIFTGTASVVTHSSTGGPNEQTARISLSVKALLTTIPNQAPSLEVQVINLNSKLTFTFRTSWSGSPRQIVATLDQNSLRNLSAQLTQSDDVLQPTNVWHAGALKALDNIGQAISDPQFSSVSAALLFPPPPPPTSDLQVEATLDWVLFQRRRTKQCHVETVTTPVPSRRYQLWHGLVANQDALKIVIAALRTGTPLATLKDAVAFQKVDVPEFAPGIATLLTQQNTIQTDWSNVKPGQDLEYGGIASSDAAKVDGNTLALARLNQLEQAIESISQPVTGTITEVLDAIHPDLAVPGVDGIIVVLTIVEKVSHNVFEVSSEFMQNLVDSVSRPGSTIILATELQRSQATFLGNVVFKLKTAEVLGDTMTAVTTAWQSRNFPAPGNAVTFSNVGDAADLIASRTDQAKAILAALGAAATVVSSPEPSQQPLGSLAPAVTVIAPGLIGVPVLVRHADVAPGQPRTARLVPWRGSFLNRTIVDLPEPAFVSFAADGSLSPGLAADVITALQKVSPAFTSVELVPGETQPDAEAQKRLDNIAEALLQAKVIQPTASRQITKIRAKEIQLLTAAGTTANEIVFLRVG